MYEVYSKISEDVGTDESCYHKCILKGGRKMIKFFSDKLRNRKGFTLVELLIVIAILGILAGIAIPRLTGITDSVRVQADESSAESLLRDAQAAILTNQIDLPADATTGDTWETVATGNGEYFASFPAAQSEAGNLTVQIQRVTAGSNSINIRVIALDGATEGTTLATACRSY